VEAQRRVDGKYRRSGVLFLQPVFYTQVVLDDLVRQGPRIPIAVVVVACLQVCRRQGLLRIFFVQKCPETSPHKQIMPTIAIFPTIAAANGSTARTRNHHVRHRGYGRQ